MPTRHHTTTATLTHDARVAYTSAMAKVAADVDIMITISHRALLTRLDRKLRKDGRRLRADRRGGDVAYLIIDTKGRKVVEQNVDLEKAPRKLDVLEPWERAALR